MSVVFRKQALADLNAIGDYIAADNPERACSFIESIKERCIKIGENPTAARLRSEWGPQIRAIVFGNYLIIYRKEEDEVLILRVIHGARDIDQLTI